MITLEEIKEWIKIDFEDDDNSLSALIKTSEAMIKSATGVTVNFIKKFSEISYDIDTSEEIKQDINDIKDLYLMIQRILINNLYENKEAENKTVISLYIQLESSYRLFVKNHSEEL